MFETLQATSRIILFLEILLVIPEKESQTFFVGINLISKSYMKLSLMKSRFKKTQNYSLQPITLLNVITDALMRVF